VEGLIQKCRCMILAVFRRTLIIFIGYLFLFAWVPDSRAEEEPEKIKSYNQLLNEVFQAETVYPQEEGEVQMLLGSTLSDGDARNLFQIPFDVEYGITDVWQVGVAWDTFVSRNPEMERSTRGIGNLEISTKYSFMNIAGSDFHAAMGVEIGFPTGDIDKELTEGFIEYEPFLILAKDFPELSHSQLFTQIGVGFVDRVKNPADPADQEPSAHELNWAVGFFVPVGSLRFTAEFNWMTNKWNNDGEENIVLLTPGVVWDLPGTWEWGIGVPVGLNNESDNFQIITQLIYEFDL
jgi:Putative MetA-pathway of phenol degradation